MVRAGTGQKAGGIKAAITFPLLLLTGAAWVVVLGGLAAARHGGGCFGYLTLWTAVRDSSAYCFWHELYPPIVDSPAAGESGSTFSLGFGWFVWAWEVRTTGTHWHLSVTSGTSAVHGVTCHTQPCTARSCYDSKIWLDCHSHGLHKGCPELASCCAHGAVTWTHDSCFGWVAAGVCAVHGAAAPH